MYYIILQIEFRSEIFSRLSRISTVCLARKDVPAISKYDSKFEKKFEIRNKVQSTIEK